MDERGQSLAKRRTPRRIALQQQGTDSGASRSKAQPLLAWRLGLQQPPQPAEATPRLANAAPFGWASCSTPARPRHRSAVQMVRLSACNRASSTGTWLAMVERQPCRSSRISSTSRRCCQLRHRDGGNRSGAAGTKHHAVRARLGLFERAALDSGAATNDGAAINLGRRRRLRPLFTRENRAVQGDGSALAHGSQMVHASRPKVSTCSMNR